MVILVALALRDTGAIGHSYSQTTVHVVSWFTSSYKSNSGAAARSSTLNVSYSIFRLNTIHTVVSWLSGHSVLSQSEK